MKRSIFKRHKLWMSLITIGLVLSLACGSMSILTTSQGERVAEGSLSDEEVKVSYTTGTTSNGQTYYDFSYTGAVQSITLSIVGSYKIEVWGAQGGNAANATYVGGYGGKGGYSVGAITISQATTYYVIVGGQGASNGAKGIKYGAKGGFGGGGGGANPWSSGNVSGGAGGGGLSGVFSSTTYNGNELIIAGGGGGGGGSASSGGSLHERGTDGGWGGGSTGGDSQYTKSQGSTVSHKSSSNAAKGATQSAGGAMNGSLHSGSASNVRGGKLYGGPGMGFCGSSRYYGYPGNASTMAGGNEITYTNSSSSAGGGGGGGGGYYGGSGSGQYGMGGSGGSGYIGRVGNYSNSSVSVTAKMYAGNQSFPNTGKPGSQGNETGHSGNGYVRITCLNSPPKNKTEEPNLSLIRGVYQSYKLNDIAKDDDKTNDTFTFADQNIYLASNNTVASSYLTYNFTNAGNNNTNSANPPSFRFTPARYFTKTRFYIRVKDNFGAVGNIYFNVTVTDQKPTINTNSYRDSKGSEYRVGLSTTGNQNEATNQGTIFNPNHGSGAKETVIIPSPIPLNASVQIQAANLYADADKDDKVMITAVSAYGGANEIYCRRNRCIRRFDDCGKQFTFVGYQLSIFDSQRCDD